MKSAAYAPSVQGIEQASFLSGLGMILELAPDALPALADGEDPATGPTVTRWLGGLGMGLARIADPESFSWPGPWLARVRPAEGGGAIRFAVMYGTPSGVVWDPAGDGRVPAEWIADGYLIAAGDIALARPPLPRPPTATGTVAQLVVSTGAGEPVRTVEAVRALAGRGLEGDRYVDGRGSFASGLPGCALTLIEAEVCDSLQPPLTADDHRRNVVTRGIALNDLVGHRFTIGSVRCEGKRLCEPCTVVQGYAGRPVLRALVHRGGLRADILTDGEIHVGDEIRAMAAEA